MTKMTFPSPCGDYGSYLQNSGLSFDQDGLGFRPLAGIMVLIEDAVHAAVLFRFRSFRPLAGIMVLI